MAAIGDVLNGRFRLDRMIGQGGFARVFLGTDLVLERQVAVKVLLPTLIDTEGGDDFLARFTAEAKLVAALDHPNILALHDFGQSDKTVFLVMPYLSGGSVHQALQMAGQFAPERMVQCVRQVAAALDYAHARNVIHRDVKPQNMLFRSGGEQLMLADFGIAKVVDEDSSRKTTRVIGSPSYMASEQFHGEVSRATDVYALGCVAFELLTGRPPYAGTTQEVLFGHVWGAIPRLTDVLPAPLSQQLQPAFDRALAKAPADRFPTAGAFADAVSAALAETATTRSPHSAVATADLATTTPRSVTPPPPLPTFSSQPTEQPHELPAETPTPSRRRLPLLFGAVAGVALLVLSIALGATLLIRARQTAGVTPESAGSTITTPEATATVAVIAALGSPAGTALLPDLEAVPLLTGHTNFVKRLAWSPDGQILVSASEDQTVRLWHADGTPIKTLRGHSGGVRSLAWSPDGTFLVSGGTDGVVNVWQADGLLLKRLTVPSGANTVGALAISPDGQWLASGSDQVYLWNTSGELVRALPVEGGVLALAWSPDSQVLAVAGKDSAAALWRIDLPGITRLGDAADHVIALAWSPGGAALATAGDRLRLWDDKGQLIATLDGHTAPLTAVAWSLDGAVLASASNDRTVRLWNPTGRLLSVLTGHTGEVTSLCWGESSGEGVLISGTTGVETLFWSETGKPLGKTTNSELWGVLAIAWSPTERVIAISGSSGAIQLWR